MDPNQAPNATCITHLGEIFVVLGSLYGVGTKASSISALSLAHRLKAVECSFQNMPLDFFLVNRSKVILTRILKLQFVALNMAHTVESTDS